MNESNRKSDAERVEFLHSLAILDTAPDENLERIVELCRLIFDVPISDISLIDGDRQWFKSMQGLNLTESPRQDAICNLTIGQDEVFEIPDTTLHEVVRENVFVKGDPGIRFYTGATVTISGHNIGALCVMDLRPHEPMTQAQRQILDLLSKIVAREIQVQSLLRKALPVVISAAETSGLASFLGTAETEDLAQKDNPGA
ncbi:GAF domain-containing protein [Candidatus Aquiluna sp. UB-MaderosW2red]|uniref:GAF domain-containing protein n=1 Tax=Candidatus Aquiluna sp. UB-MaderosW2red TaxID=1855377 RepID=UPI000875B275|nr:GAF domain-containing protein [Candidatus Aquiluna sp. UB-MaderosW2red]SCX14880.1 GAF domain-containing protein [Candidatus Aquiluna sp. UB-MaderosW2red]